MNRRGYHKYYTHVYNIDDDWEYEERKYSKVGWFMLPAVGLLGYISWQKPEIPEQDVLPKIEQVAKSGDEFYLEVIKHQMITFEGGYSGDKNDPGNYYKGKLVGTKHGIAASFALNLGLSEDSLKNLTVDDAAKLLSDYSAKDINFKNSSNDFLLIYSLYTFYYGKHRADYFICLYYAQEPNAYNAKEILESKKLDKKLAEYLRDKFEILLINSFVNDLNRPYPLYSHGWYRRYVSVLSYWKEKGYTTLEPTEEFKEKAKAILTEINEKRGQVSTTADTAATDTSKAANTDIITEDQSDESAPIGNSKEEAGELSQNLAPGKQYEEGTKRLSNYRESSRYFSRRRYL